MCMICDDETKETKYLPLYVIGSEGLNVCHQCEMIIVHFVRDLMQLSTKVKLNVHKSIQKRGDKK